MKEFYARLLVCEYQRNFLIPAITKGIKGACAFNKRGSVHTCLPDKNKDTQGHVFFHLTYHPRDPTSKVYSSNDANNYFTCHGSLPYGG